MNDTRHGLGAVLVQARPEIGDRGVGDIEDALRIIRELALAEGLHPVDHMHEQHGAEAVADQHRNHDDTDQLDSILEGSRQRQNEAHVHRLADQGEHQGNRPGHALFFEPGLQQTSAQPFNGCCKGTGKCREAPRINEEAMPARDQSCPQPDHRTAKQTRRDHCHGPEVGDGIKDRIAAVGAQNAKRTEEQRREQQALEPMLAEV